MNQELDHEEKERVHRGIWGLTTMGTVKEPEGLTKIRSWCPSLYHVSAHLVDQLDEKKRKPLFFTVYIRCWIVK